MPHPNAPESTPTTAFFDFVGSGGTGTVDGSRYEPSTIPNLVLSTAFSDIRHSQCVPVILIVGFEVSEGPFGPSGHPEFRASLISRAEGAREVGGNVLDRTHPCFIKL
jgi:hypothetical protein